MASAAATSTTAAMGPTHWSLLVACTALVLVCYLAVYAFYSWHQRTQRLEAERSTVLQETENFSVNLVRHLVPSISVEKYRFRGMHGKTMTVSLQFKDLSLQLKSNGARLLQGITGSFAAGRMAAVMGPTGSGKTSLMNVLTGKAHYGVASGTVTVNGEETSLASLKPVMGFVPQDDTVHENLTVREQIFYSAKLRNRADTTDDKIDCIVEDVLTVMQLTRIQHSVVGGIQNKGISGGQRKRVNIGLELATCPALLFLDEPTTGLDATSALGVVYSLKKLTELGMTMIMVIHQPRYSLFTLFDDVLLLGMGGRTAYLGPTPGVKPYFEGLGFCMPRNENPANWIMDILSGEVSHESDPELRPATLLDLWQDRGAEYDGESEPLTRARSSRDWTESDDRGVLKQALDDEWERMDVNSDGVLQGGELAEVLASCTGSRPPQGVVDELFARMGGTKGFVTKIQFLDFLLGMLGTIAKDFETERVDGHVQRIRAHSSSPSSVRTVLEDPDDHSFDEPERGDSLAAKIQGRPAFCQQYCTLLHRALVGWARQTIQRTMGVAFIVITASIFGIIKRGTIRVDDPAMSWNIESTLVGLSVMMAVYCLNIFGLDRPVFWRESSSGINVLAFYLSRLTVAVIDVVVLSVLYTSVWCLWVRPADHASVYLWPFLAAGFNAASWGVLISTLISPRSSTLAAAVFLIVLGAAVSAPKTVSDAVGGPFRSLVVRLSFYTWSAGLSFLGAVDANGGPQALSSPTAASLEHAYREMLRNGLGCISGAYVVLICMHVVLVIAGYLGLRFKNRACQA